MPGRELSVVGSPSGDRGVVALAETISWCVAAVFVWSWRRHARHVRVAVHNRIGEGQSAGVDGHEVVSGVVDVDALEMLLHGRLVDAPVHLVIVAVGLCEQGHEDEARHAKMPTVAQHAMSVLVEGSLGPGVSGPGPGLWRSDGTPWIVDHVEQLHEGWDTCEGGDGAIGLLYLAGKVFEPEM